MTNDIYLAAAEWHSRMSEEGVTAADRARLSAWRAENPEHDKAYTAIERMWENTSDIGTDHRILEFRREALRPRFMRRYRSMAAAILVTVGIVAGAYHFVGWNGGESPIQANQQTPTDVFTTALGQRSQISLADGSSINLNSASKVMVTYSGGERYVRLVYGQAGFMVAKNPARPFIVDAGGQRVTALGTAFDVRLDDKEKSVRVTLVEGRVTVVPSPSAGQRARSATPPVVLAPGESLTIGADRAVLSKQADINKTISWWQGQILFDGDTLERAIAEVNRYSPRKIVLADPALASLQVSGLFNAGHIDSFVDTVTAHYAISAIELPDGSVALSAKASTNR